MKLLTLLVLPAAKSTKTKQVGFVGGMKGEVIDRFEAGFVAGVKSVDESIKIDIQYAGSFGDACKGQTIAASNTLEVQILFSTLLVVLVMVCLPLRKLKTKLVMKQIKFG